MEQKIARSAEWKIGLVVVLHFIFMLFAVMGAGASQGATMFIPFIVDLPITILYVAVTIPIGISLGFSDWATQLNLILAYIFFPGLGTFLWWRIVRKIWRWR